MTTEGDCMIKTKKNMLSSGIIDLVFSVLYGILAIVMLGMGIAMLSQIDDSYGITAVLAVLFFSIAGCSLFGFVLSIVSTVLCLKRATQKLPLEYASCRVQILVAAVLNFVECAVFVIAAIAFACQEKDQIVFVIATLAVSFVIGAIRATCGGLKLKALSDLKKTAACAEPAQTDMVE